MREDNLLGTQPKRFVVTTNSNHKLEIYLNYLKTVVAGPPLLSNPEPPGPGESFATRRELVPEEAYSADFLTLLYFHGSYLQLRSDAPRRSALLHQGQSTRA